jgi:redox-sensitive bicupin YhaK (pirin superfamily)
MEIVTYVINGQIEHRDTMGNSGVISPGEIQRMSAGTGLRHSEFNPSDTDPAEIVQLWLFPAVPQLAPAWELKAYSNEQRQGRLLPIVVPAGTANKPAQAVEVHQDATIYTSQLAEGQSVAHTLAPGRRAYIFVVGGDIDINVNGQLLNKGDQARITGETELRLIGSRNGEAAGDFLLLDLP